MNDFSGYDRYRHDEYTVLGRISAPEEHLVEDARTKRHDSHETIASSPKRKKTYGKSRIFLTVIVTIFAFSLTLFAADLLSGKSGLASYVALFTQKNKNESTVFYAVYAMKSEDMALAYKNASAVRAEGAAGYVLKEKEQYYVVLNIYDNASDAKAVKEKSVDYDIIELRAPVLDTKSDKYSFLAQTNDLHHNAYLALYEAANDLAAAKYKEEDMKRRLEKHRERVSAELEAYAESIKGKEDNARIEYKVFLSEVKSAFDNLLSVSENLVADARYYSVMILHSYTLFATKIAGD